MATERARHPSLHTGTLTIGEGCSIHKTVDFDLTGSIRVGDYCYMGEGVILLTHTHPIPPRGTIMLGGPKDAGVQWHDLVIESDVWLYPRSIILPQVTLIPRGVIIGAGSVLTRNPGEYEIWAGNPARKVGER